MGPAMDFSANLYNSRTWILDTVQKVLLSKANTEKRVGEAQFKNPHNPPNEKQNSQKSLAKTSSFFDFYILFWPKFMNALFND